MELKAKINQDLKNALRSGDHTVCDTLRLLKSEVTNQEISLGLRESGLSDDQVEQVVMKEAKKRREAAEMYSKAGRAELAEREKTELEILKNYLPKMLSEAEVRQIVDEAVNNFGSKPVLSDMGKIIGVVKSKVGNSADGAMVALLVKERLSQ